MSDNRLPLTNMIVSVFRTWRRHLLTGWPIAVVWTACFAAALYYAGAGMPPVLPLALSVIGIVVLIIWEAGVLRAMTGAGAGFKLGAGELRYAVSFILYGIILLFAATIILLPVILATLALMALVSFDPAGPKPTAEQTQAAWDAFRGHPLFYVCVGFFAAGLAAMAATIMRGAGYAAACVAERRIVAMEAFHWTRGSNTYLLGLGLTIVVPFVLLSLAAAGAMHGLSGSQGGRLLASFLMALTAWPGMLAALALSAEFYKRFRSAPPAT